MSDHLRLGETTIHRIVEQEGPFFEAKSFFNGLTDEVLAEHRSWLEPRYIEPGTGKVVLCIQSYLIVQRGLTILVDSCVGNHKPRPTRPFWNMMAGTRYEHGLSRLGVTVDDIDMVMCTHLHGDHVGWNTRLDNGRWVPTFPKARYVFADRELAFWAERVKTAPETCPWITDSVLPIVAAKREMIVKSDHALDDNVRLIPTPGHTIDHFSVHVGRTGADAIVTGDMIHSPLQARYPEMGMTADYDSKLAGQSRRSLFTTHCDSATRFCTAHFPSPSVGRLTRWGDGFRFVEG